MRILFLGGDKRQLQIIASLYNQHQIDVIGYDNVKLLDDIKIKEIENIDINNYKVIILPVSGVEEDLSVKAEFSKKKVILPIDLLVNTSEDVVIFTGIRTNKLNMMLKLSNRKVIALMEDKEIVKENSIPTIEGIIGDLIYNTEHTINESNIFILGYGNIGKSLASILKMLGAHVTVGVGFKNDYNLVKKKKIKGVLTYEYEMMREALNNSDIIINTIPALVLNKEQLEMINRQCYILDIASYPHGIDFNYVNELKIRGKLLLGIPSLVAPKTAGLILAKKINSVLGGKK